MKEEEHANKKMCSMAMTERVNPDSGVQFVGETIKTLCQYDEFVDNSDKSEKTRINSRFY